MQGLASDGCKQLERPARPASGDVCAVLRWDIPLGLIQQMVKAALSEQQARPTEDAPPHTATHWGGYIWRLQLGTSCSDGGVTFDASVTPGPPSGCAPPVAASVRMSIYAEAQGGQRLGRFAQVKATDLFYGGGAGVSHNLKYPDVFGPTLGPCRSFDAAAWQGCGLAGNGKVCLCVALSAVP